MRRRLRVTSRGTTIGVVALIALAAGWWARYPGVVGLGLAGVAAVVLALGSLLAAPALQLGRQAHGTTVRRLTPLEVPMLVGRHRGRRPDAVTVAERIGGALQTGRSVAIPGAGSVSIAWPVDTTLPGRILLGPARISRTAVAGLAAVRIDLGPVDEVVVLARRLPVTIPDAATLPQERALRFEVEGAGTELRALRQYVVGDDLRRVNARISARAGTMMIRQDAEPALSTLLVVIDNAAGIEPIRFAEMLDIATSLVGAARVGEIPCAWAARGATGGATVGASSGPGADRWEEAIACLPPESVGLPRPAPADLLVLVTDDTHLAASAGALHSHGDHRMMVALCVTSPSAPRGAGSDSARGFIVISATTAEECLRSFGRLGAGRGSAR